jgi:hypothetical protein
MIEHHLQKAILHALVVRPTARFADLKLRKRLAHPTYGKIGFIHGEPVAGEPIADTANAILSRRTGLPTADFTVVGSGYIRIFQQHELESFTAFTMLNALIGHGAPKAKDETGENLWLVSPDFTGDDMLDSMADLIHHLEASQDLFFADLTYHSLPNPARND